MAQFVLENEWLRAEFHSRGAALSRLVYKPLSRDIILTCDDHSSPFHYTNTIVGPIANRISNGRYSINDKVIQLDQNEGTTCLHSGVNGLSELAWIGRQIADKVEFKITCRSDYGDYPNIATYTTRYQLTGQTLHLNLSGVCDQIIAMNLAPHLYFTLGAENIKVLKLMVNSDQYLPTDKNKIPTGHIAAVKGTKFDFTSPTLIDARQIDHSFCLTNPHLVASLTYNQLVLNLRTSAPALQVYTADHLGRTALAIEPQGWPNAVNQPDFPSQIVPKWKPWSEHSILQISEIL